MLKYEPLILVTLKQHRIIKHSIKAYRRIVCRYKSSLTWCSCWGHGSWECSCDKRHEKGYLEQRHHCHENWLKKIIKIIMGGGKNVYQTIFSAAGTRADWTVLTLKVMKMTTTSTIWHFQLPAKYYFSVVLQYNCRKVKSW